jgi:hypothetical protein
MRRLLVGTACATLFAALGLAETFTGKLIDTSCLQQEKPTVAACQPTSSTTSFALADETGKIYKFDDEGNTKAAKALKDRADRAADPNSKSQENSAVQAKVTGEMDGNTLKVDTIEVQ